jgi:hypothetical protein
VTRRAFLVISSAFGALALFAACEPPLDRAIDPAWGKQPCGHCAMLLQDREAAAEVVTKAGERLFFDDIGCMVSWIDDKKASHVEAAHAWVRAPGGGGWVDARATLYTAGARTPMDFGFLAVREGHDAISYDEMATRVLRRRDAAAAASLGGSR